MSKDITGLDVYEKIANKLRQMIGAKEASDNLKAVISAYAKGFTDGNKGFANVFGDQALEMVFDQQRVNSYALGIWDVAERHLGEGKSVAEVEHMLQPLAMETLPHVITDGLQHHYDAMQRVTSITKGFGARSILDIGSPLPDSTLPRNISDLKKGKYAEDVIACAQEKYADPVRSFSGKIAQALEEYPARLNNPPAHVLALADSAGEFSHAIEAVEFNGKPFLEILHSKAGGRAAFLADKLGQFVNLRVSEIVDKAHMGTPIANLAVQEAQEFAKWVIEEGEIQAPELEGIKTELVLKPEFHNVLSEKFLKVKAEHTPKPKAKEPPKALANDNKPPKAIKWSMGAKIGAGVAALATGLVGFGFVSGAFRSKNNGQPNGQGVSGMSPEQQLRAGGDAGRNAIAQKVLDEKKYEKYGRPEDMKRPKVDVRTQQEDELLNAASRGAKPGDEQTKPDSDPKPVAGVGGEPAGQPRDVAAKPHVAMAAGAADVSTLIEAAEVANMGPVNEAAAKEVASA